MTAETLYRALSPRFSHAPLSGRGAELSGGRWNAVGTPALYLAGDVITAILEYQQRAAFKPVTAIQYELEQARIADIADVGIRNDYEITDAVATNAWQIIVGLGNEPPSWRIASALQADCFDGLRYRSRMNGGLCVVLWRWNAPGAPTLTAVDPDNRLPKSDRSWISS